MSYNTTVDPGIVENVRGIHKHGLAILGTGVTFTGLAALSGGMRVLAKQLSKSPYGWEDWTALLALAVYIVAEVLVLKSATGVYYAPPSQVVFALSIYLEYTYIYTIFYFQILGLCITSILLLYRRIFTIPYIRRATTSLLVVTFLWWIPVTVIHIGQPVIPRLYPGDPDDPHWSIAYLPFWLTIGIVELLLILIATHLPLRQIYKLQLRGVKRKILTVAFASSYLCLITGILRLALLYRPSFDLSYGDVWLNIHCGTAVISINLPCCWPLISHRSQLKSLILLRDSKSSSSGSTQTVTTDTTTAIDRLTVGSKKKSNPSMADDQAAIAVPVGAFDPRPHTTSWSQAGRVDSNEQWEQRQQEPVQRSSDMTRQVELGQAIGVTRTVLVQNNTRRHESV